MILLDFNFKAERQHTGLHRHASKSDRDNLMANMCRDFMEALKKKNMRLCSTHHRKEFFVLVGDERIYKPVADVDIDSSLEHFIIYNGNRWSLVPFIRGCREYLRRLVFVPVDYIERDIAGQVVTIDGLPVVRGGME